MASSDLPGITLIKRAIELDSNKRYADALVCYREGIELLIETLKSNIIICHWYGIKNVINIFSTTKLYKKKSEKLLFERRLAATLAGLKF